MSHNVFLVRLHALRFQLLVPLLCLISCISKTNCFTVINQTQHFHKSLNMQPTPSWISYGLLRFCFQFRVSAIWNCLYSHQTQHFCKTIQYLSSALCWIFDCLFQYCNQPRASAIRLPPQSSIESNIFADNYTPNTFDSKSNPDN